MALFSAEDGLERLPGLFEGGRLSPTQRRVARYVADHPREAPFLSSVDLASRAGVSQPTVTRLAAALGYGGYGEFQKDLRRTVLGASEESGGNKFQAAVDEEIGNLRALRGSLEDEGTVARLGRDLASSVPLVVVGLRASAPLAGYFSYFAEKLHPDVRAITDRGGRGRARARARALGRRGARAPPTWLSSDGAGKLHPDVRAITDGGSAGTDRLSQARRAGAGWALCFVMPRYPREALGMMEYAIALGMRVVAVSDRVGG